jgi:hypothetical protein
MSFSNESDPFTYFHGGGLRNHQNQSGLPRIRGEMLGIPITNDV